MRFWFAVVVGGSIATALVAACSDAPDSSGVVGPGASTEGGAGDGGGSVTSGTGSTSGSGSGSTSGVSTGSSAGGVVDSGPVSCDAALPIADSGGACTACKVKSCAMLLAQCQADCACNQIEVCLEQQQSEFLNACPNAVNASIGGNMNLTMLIDCLDTNCLAPCFPSDVSDAAAD